MTKKQVKKMMKNLNIKLLYEDKNSLEYENSCYGNPISFVFDKGILINIYS